MCVCVRANCRQDKREGLRDGVRVYVSQTFLHSCLVCVENQVTGRCTVIHTRAEHKTVSLLSLLRALKQSECLQNQSLTVTICQVM